MILWFYTSLCDERDQPQATPSTPDPPDPREGVQQIGSRVSSVIQHLVEGEHVIVQSVVGEICVFNTSESN